MSIPDNDFASHFFGLIGWDRPKPDEGRTSTLCAGCHVLDTTNLFKSEYILSELQAASESCEICAILNQSIREHNHRSSQALTVRLRCQDGVVGLEDGPDLLTIYTSGPDIPDGSRIGLPKLLGPGSKAQFLLLRQWIRDCDDKHESCRPDQSIETRNSLSPGLPTRLLEVTESHLRLVDSKSTSYPSDPLRTRYVALSHCWGKLSVAERFCTYKANIAQFRDSIDVEATPKTFRDAITITRGLGIHYLWIDSLCIIQDDKADWEHEADRMEDVFSAAYVTLAASAAKSQLDGFLRQRPERACVRVDLPPTPGRKMQTLYVCPAIDDFRRDVELSKLNRRGWVFQERALSRRTIFFAERQIYWECGAGIRCETLSKLLNSKAAFLGDANFPKSALEYYRAGRQVLVQDLYERYSDLEFTKPADRAVAILGLQDRLARAFETRASLGFIAVYFARGLLWRPKNPRSMMRIPPNLFTGSGGAPPTWSWFSKEGAIKYMEEIRFEKVLWANGPDKPEFENPFEKWDKTDSGRDKLGVLRACLRKLNVTNSDMSNDITFDEERLFQPSELHCVVIGRDKPEEAPLGGPRYHVLIIHRVETRVGSDEGKYERVGVASLKRQHVGRRGPWISIR